MQINLIGPVFYFIFLAIFCFSGVISLLSGFTYRLGLVSLIVFPLLLFYRPQFDKVLLLYFLLTFVIFISAIYNESTIFDFIEFMRIPIFSYLMYVLVKLYVHRDNIDRFFKWLVVIAVIQLPVIIAQWELYDYLPLRWRGTSIKEDFGFGTFHYMSDYAMSYFLALVLLLLLFNEESMCFVKRRKLLVFWLTLTVFIANSHMCKLIVLFFWMVYIFRSLSIRSLLRASLILIVVSTSLTFLYQKNFLPEKPTSLIDRMIISAKISTDVDRYLAGKYARSAAIYYYFGQKVNWIGDGPSYYYNVYTRESLRGNKGHSFTFYSEVGLFGLGLSFIIFYSIAFQSYKPTKDSMLVPALMVISIVMLAFTNQVMNHIAIAFSYCLIAKKNQLSPVLKKYNNRRVEDNDNMLMQKAIDEPSCMLGTRNVTENPSLREIHSNEKIYTERNYKYASQIYCNFSGMITGKPSGLK